MEDLINAIITRLRDQISTVRDTSIWVAESLDVVMIPQHVTLPAIAVKDGRETERPAYQAGAEITRIVEVAAIVQVFREGDTIVGASGVLRLDAAVKAALNDNTLSITGCTLAVTDGADPSRTIYTETDMAQMKKRTMRYELYENY